MARIILLVALFVVLYYVFRQIAAAWRTQDKSVGSPQQKLVQCTHCGLHVPEDESIAIHGKYYCLNPKCNPESDQDTFYDS